LLRYPNPRRSRSLLLLSPDSASHDGAPSRLRLAPQRTAHFGGPFAFATGSRALPSSHCRNRTAWSKCLGKVCLH